MVSSVRMRLYRIHETATKPLHIMMLDFLELGHTGQMCGIQILYNGHQTGHNNLGIEISDHAVFGRLQVSMI